MVIAKNLLVFWTNMGYWSQETFKTESEALAYIKSKCFEGAVWEKNGEDHELIVSWSPIGGTRWHQKWNF